MLRFVPTDLFSLFFRQTISCRFLLSPSPFIQLHIQQQVIQPFSNQAVDLSTQNKKMQLPKLSEVVSVLKNLAPLEHAAEWDNVGLLIEPTGDLLVKKIFLANDLTESVMDEAIGEGANLIVSYHPPLFRPFKRLTQRSWKERVALRCIEHRIALYSPHTALDAVQGGINDWLLAPLPTNSLRPIQPSRFSLLPFDYLIRVTLNPSLTQPESFEAKLPSSTNYLLKHENENNYHISCNKDTLSLIINTLNLTNGVTIQALTSNEKVPLLNEGSGRIATLSESMSIDEIINKMKQHLELSNLRCALAKSHTRDTMVQSVAVCAGSGASVLCDVTTDLVITGEMSHHEVLDMVNRGTTVILSEHSNSERGYLKHLQQLLLKQLQATHVIISKCDSDPLVIV